MEILLYLIASILILMGLGTWKTATQSRHPGHYLGGACYVAAGVAATLLPAWWPLFAGFIAAYLVRAVFGDPVRGSQYDRLGHLSRILGDVRMADSTSADYFNAQDAAENELFCLVLSSPGLRPILEEYRVSKDTLRQLYTLLVLLGAGQWAGGHWVPASALAQGDTLEYLLHQIKDQSLPSPDAGLLDERWKTLEQDEQLIAAAATTVMYFAGERLLPARPA